MKRVLFALMLLAGSGAYAQEPPAPIPDLAIAKAIITSYNGGEIPPDWPAGVPLILSAEKSLVGDRDRSILWESKPDLGCTRIGKFFVIATGRNSRNIEITLTVGKGDEVDKQVAVIKVIGDTSPPKPDIDPDVPIPVPTPAGNAKIREAINLARASPGFKSECAALGANYRKLIDAINLGLGTNPNYAQYKNVNFIKVEMKRMNAQTLATVQSSWSETQLALAKYMATVPTNTPQECVKMFEDIATEFEKQAQ